jgi:TRAP-type C4-dicarboxylate transport system permease large subunit
LGKKAFNKTAGFRAKINRIVKAIAPFYNPPGTVLVMITFIPGLVTWLPKLLMDISK